MIPPAPNRGSPVQEPTGSPSLAHSLVSAALAWKKEPPSLLDGLITSEGSPWESAQDLTEDPQALPRALTEEPPSQCAGWQGPLPASVLTSSRVTLVTVEPTLHICAKEQKREMLRQQRTQKSLLITFA